MDALLGRTNGWGVRWGPLDAERRPLALSPGALQWVSSPARTRGSLFRHRLPWALVSSLWRLCSRWQLREMDGMRALAHLLCRDGTADAKCLPGVFQHPLSY